jgi:hypothetical protein
VSFSGSESGREALQLEAREIKEEVFAGTENAKLEAVLYCSKTR